MTVPFILMTLACAIMAITISLQWRRIKQQENLISDFNEKGFREVMGYGKVYRRRYIFVNIENAGNNGTLNSVAENYYDHGFDLDREKSTDRLLVFVKSEEVKGKFIDWRMTEEELKKVPFRETCHMAMEGEYTTTYMSKDGRLGFCDHVPRDEFGMVKKGGRAVRHFMIDGKVYKSKKKFLEAIKDYNP